MTVQNLEQVTKGEVIALIAKMRTSKLEPKKSSGILRAISDLTKVINENYTQPDWATLQTHSHMPLQITKAYYFAKEVFEKPAPKVSGGMVDVYKGK